RSSRSAALSPPLAAAARRGPPRSRRDRALPPLARTARPPRPASPSPPPRRSAGLGSGPAPPRPPATPATRRSAASGTRPRRSRRRVGLFDPLRDAEVGGGRAQRVGTPATAGGQQDAGSEARYGVEEHCQRADSPRQVPEDGAERVGHQPTVIARPPVRQWL